MNIVKIKSSLLTGNKNCICSGHSKYKDIALSFILITVLLASVNAIGNLAFTYSTNENGSITINRYTGSDGSVSIPAQINGRPVTIIGTNAFDRCSSLSSIVIPDTVIDVGDYAFNECSGLTTATVGASVTNIGNYAFNECKKLIKIELGDNVIVFGNEAFYDCLNLKSINLGSKAKLIGFNTFAQCETLSSIEIPDSVTNIEDYAFFTCVNLKDVTIGNSVSCIGREAFSHCVKLNSIIIPESVSCMWDEVFYHCSSLSSAYFLGDVPDYDNGGFFDLTSPQFIIYYLPGKNGWDHFYEDYKTKEYTGPYGSLQVQLLPNQMTINMGAQWRVDSGEWQGSGTTVSGLFPSRHTIKFSEVNGWTKPTNQIVSIQDNTTTKVTATYQVDGALHVTIEPETAIDSGAQWQIDGGMWYNSGVTVSNISQSKHTISFSTVDGWMTPPDQIITVKSNSTMTVTGTYLSKNGSIEVSITPTYAIDAGALWKVDDGEWQSSGTTVSDVTPGDHTIIFSDINGWITPNSQIVTVNTNSTTTTTGIYVPQGAVVVGIITPATAIDAGAKWKLDNGAWHTSGTTIMDVVLGLHSFSCNTIDGWTTPPSIEANIQTNGIIFFTGNYTQQLGSINLTITPTGAVKAGAKWSVDYGKFYASGSTVSNLSVGSHTITFSAISGWHMPSNQNVTISNGKVTYKTATYTEIDNQPPTLTLSVKGTQISSNASFTMRGKCSDNVAVSSVWYCKQNDAWQKAITTDGWTNWTGNVTLVNGTNVLRAYAIDNNGNYSSTATVNVVFIPYAALNILTNGFGSVSPNYDDQFLVIGNSYSIKASACKGALFVGWSNSVSGQTTTNPVLSFVMQSNLTLVATFISNPFISVAGEYSGLFTNANGAGPQGYGFFTAMVSTNGSFSAQLQASNKYSFSSKFSLDGTWSGRATSGTVSPVVSLQLDFGGQNRITGVISNTTWTAILDSHRNVFSKTNPAAQSREKYTMAIAGEENSALQPGGYGYGTVSVDINGKVNFSGILGDGTVVTSSSTLSQEGLFPFYSSLYSKKGFILGWLTFTNLPDRDISGWLTWINSNHATTKMYSGGFTNQSEAVGSGYTYTNGMRALGFTNGVLVLKGGNLQSEITNSFLLKNNNQATGSNIGKLIFANATGLFSGTVTNSSTHKTLVISGVVVQKLGSGFGLFSGTNQTGSVILSQDY